MHATGAQIDGRYTILGEAGSGGTAWVYKAFDATLQAIVALKIYKTEGRDEEVATEIWHREVESLSKLRHDSIARYLAAGRVANTNVRYIATEWIDGATLEDHLAARGKLTWEQFFSDVGNAILSALVHAAELGITHRDVSTRNVIVSVAGVPKIIDFGQARLSDFQLGKTVSAWHTPPYCPPETDTGQFTLTRDAFAFCAIAVRALAGYELRDHDALYRALSEIALEESRRALLQRAISREPRERFRNSIELAQALGASRQPRDDDAQTPAIPIRLLPELLGVIGDHANDTSESRNPTEIVIREMNDTVAISQQSGGANGHNLKLDIETQSFRLKVDVDHARRDHLVVVRLSPKRYRLDHLYQHERWLPQVQFTAELPRTREQRAAAATALDSFYQDFEHFQASKHLQSERSFGVATGEWGRLLDALRHIARHEVPALRYKSPDQDGRWLTVVVENPDDAEIGEVRTISVEGRWVFRGEIDSIRGNQVVLVSTRPRFDLEALPRSGELENDWQQTKVSLDRQGRAVNRIKAREIPNPALGRLLTGEELGPEEPTFAMIHNFFDGGLDAPKKEIVSRCGTAQELLVTHGPPGTGKTKLIVELIRQALAAHSNAKILLVSQTHIALDNALERMLRSDPSISCVRIGSGVKEIDPRVASCTVEERSRRLREEVEKAGWRFIEQRAIAAGTRPEDVELALRAADVLGVRTRQQNVQEELALARRELQQTEDSLDKGTTDDRSARRVRAGQLEDAIDRWESTAQQLEVELSIAVERLRDLSVAGRALATAEDSALRDCATLLVHSKEHRDIADLIELSEAWKLKFGQSDDLRAAMIVSSAVVAGTCVGFCREIAAARIDFDLCIIDEAGKATTTELLVPLAQSKRAVIVGDHYQLPAVVDHALQNPELLDRFGVTKDQIERQLFEELTERLRPGCQAKLSTQYRMRGAIGSLISTCFYSDQLHSDPSTSSRDAIDIALAGITKSVTWVNPYMGTNKDRVEYSEGSSYGATIEAQCIVQLLRRLAFVFDKKRLIGPWPSVAVITGYSAQANNIRNEIRRDSSLDALKVDCSTVHAFQGREVDICIYSVARRNRRYHIGMLKDWRHLNVALSRARDYLVIVGDITFCRDVPQPNPFSRIVEFVTTSGSCDYQEWSDD